MNISYSTQFSCKACSLGSNEKTLNPACVRVFMHMLERSYTPLAVELEETEKFCGQRFVKWTRP